MNKWKRIGKDEKGQSLVEFALVLPILLLFLLGIIEFGWLLNAQISLTSAAREGARLAAVEKIEEFDESDIIALIQPTVDNNFSQFKVSPSIDPNLITGTGVYLVEIKLEGNIKPLVGFFIKEEFFPIKADARMRLENYFPDP